MQYMASNKRKVQAVYLWISLLFSFHIQAQMPDHRVQYPAVFAHSYFKVNLGYINYPFSNEHLKAGFKASSVQVPHAAVGLILFGHQFTPFISAQISYMRPVQWVQYHNINGDGQSHSVWMNIGGLTIKATTPGVGRFSFYGEGGWGIVTRKGFHVNDTVVLADINYNTILLGAGIQYRIKNKWDLVVNASYAPRSQAHQQPYTLFYGAGFIYRMIPLEKKQIDQVTKAGYIFPEHLVQVGLTNNVLGYGVNNFVANDKFPIFWGGDAQVSKGISLSFQKNIFHTKKVFSFDLGSGISYYRTKNHADRFVTLSLYPLMRFTFMRTSAADLYLNYSVAGPTYISKRYIDGNDTGRSFTFQDFMGLGVYAGAKKKINAEVRILHYSNGNLFPQNAGVMIPTTFTLGYAL